MIDIEGINIKDLQSNEPDIGWLIYFERVIIGNLVLDQIDIELKDGE